MSVASAVLPLAEELRVTYAEAGTLIGVNMLPGALLSLRGELFGQRFGDKAVCAAGLGLMVLGGLFMGASSGYA